MGSAARRGPEEAAWNERTLGRVSHDRAWELAMPGAAYVALAGLMAYELWVR